MAKRIIPLVTKLGYKDEPYYRGEFDRHKELKRILNYKATDIIKELTPKEWINYKTTEST